MPPRPRKRWKNVLFGVIAVLVGPALLLGGLEVFLRVRLAHAFQAGTANFLIPSKVTGLHYEMPPNFWQGSLRTDARGLRWRPPDIPPARHSVLVVGDSVALAGGVPVGRNFVELLEQDLSARLGQKVAVWNAAVPGYNTVQEAIQVERLAPLLQPRLVIVQFCLNDYLDPPVLTSGAALDASHAERQSFSLFALLYSSRAIFFLKEKFKDLQKTYPEWFPVWAHYIHHVHKRQGWETVKTALIRIRAATGRSGSRLLFVLFPVEQQLRIQDRAPQADLVAFAQANGIPVLDLYDSFRPHWREGLFMDYLESVGVVDKIHLNERGHALAARQIAATVLRTREQFPSAATAR
jgi:lysophospholipase L1-like esterase